MINLNCLMDHILYETFMIVLSIASKNISARACIDTGTKLSKRIAQNTIILKETKDYNDFFKKLHIPN